MNFGKLNRAIDIESYTETRTSSGSVVKNWAKLATVFAQVKYMTGGEKSEADQLQGYNVVEFIIRPCTGLKANELQRVKYNNEYFNIEYINQLENDKYQQLITRRKTIWQEQ